MELKLYWHARYSWARLSGSLRRLLGLSFPNSRTISEIVYELERDPLMRVVLGDARKKLKAENAVCTCHITKDPETESLVHALSCPARRLSNSASADPTSEGMK